MPCRSSVMTSKRSRIDPKDKKDYIRENISTAVHGILPTEEREQGETEAPNQNSVQFSSEHSKCGIPSFLPSSPIIIPPLSPTVICQHKVSTQTLFSTPLNSGIGIQVRALEKPTLSEEAALRVEQSPVRSKNQRTLRSKSKQLQKDNKKEKLKIKPSIAKENNKHPPDQGTSVSSSLSSHPFSSHSSSSSSTSSSKNFFTPLSNAMRFGRATAPWNGKYFSKEQHPHRTNAGLNYTDHLRTQGGERQEKAYNQDQLFQQKCQQTRSTFNTHKILKMLSETSPSKDNNIANPSILPPPPPPPPPTAIVMSQAKQNNSSIPALSAETNTTQLSQAHHLYDEIHLRPPQTFMVEGYRIHMVDYAKKVFAVDLRSPETCDKIVKRSEDHCRDVRLQKKKGEDDPITWRKLYTYTKMDLPCAEVPGMAELYTDDIISDVKKVVGSIFGNVQGANRLRPRSWKEPHLLKYQKIEGQKPHTGVEMHYDGCDITWQIMLSEPGDYDAGGTYFRYLRKTVVVDKGQVLIHPGELYHKGVDITRGTRRMIVGFMDGFDPGIIDDSPADHDSSKYEHNEIRTWSPKY